MHRRRVFGYQPHLEGGVEIYRILALNSICFGALLASVDNQINVTDRRPVASRLAQPVAWLEEYLTPATKGAALPKTWITADYFHRGNSRVEW